ncbi:hypothetical protein MERGE_002802 [Pneumocystis wakefieldiae]|uniref:Uncharacterized protein n=1 Tax=Pneumocystis wakefieldiae TaxID=38082 RepID=A0A899FND3_9ASCO|nr:hypothetical protein MERGE_002802 [Pneumocystis wakefieldiae]
MILLKPYVARRCLFSFRYSSGLGCKLNHLYSIFPLEWRVRMQRTFQTSNLLLFYSPYPPKIRNTCINYIKLKNHKENPRNVTHENIYTVPNFLTFSRLIVAPITGYYYLFSVIFGKDILLGLFAIYYRWISLSPPCTLVRYFDFSIPSVEIKPTLISKINTALQHFLIGVTIIHPFIHSEILSASIIPIQFLVFITTIWSGLSYVYTKDAIHILNAQKNR